MSQIIDTLYDGNLGCDGPHDVFRTASSVLHFEQKLLDWQRTLPNSLPLVENHELVLQSCDDLAMPQLRLRVILTLRYLNLRILTHRPILQQFLESLTIGSASDRSACLDPGVGMVSLRSCVRAATSTIRIVEQALDIFGGRGRPLGAWWFTLYYGEDRPS